jgi:capsular exopolysaccharide synthesis family protein
MDEKEATTQSIDSVWEYLNIARKRKWLIISIVAVALICGIIYNMFEIPTYTASATFAVEKSQLSTIGVKTAADQDTTYNEKENIEQIIKSYNFIKEVMIELKLDQKIIRTNAINVFSDSDKDQLTKVIQFYSDNIIFKQSGSTKSQVYIVTVNSQYAEDSAAVANALVKKFELYVDAARKTVVNLTINQGNKQVSALQEKINVLVQKLEEKKKAVSYDKVAVLDRYIDIYESHIKELVVNRDSLYGWWLYAENETVKADAEQALKRQDEKIDMNQKELEKKLIEKSSLITSENYNEIKEIESSIDLHRKVLATVLENKETNELANSLNILMSSKTIRLVNPAFAPIKPEQSTTVKNILFALIIGLALSGGLAYGIDLMDPRFKYVDEAEKVLGLPILAKIPEIESLTKVKSLVIDESSVLEAFRTLRTNIRFTGIKNKVILFSSPAAKAGKSLTVANLGLIMDTYNDKTVIIDADLRLSNIHHLFKLERQPGLSDVIEGKAELKNVIKKVKNNLYIIPAGTTVKNPQKLLESAKMSEMLNVLKKKFDYVLIDSVPINYFTDGQILASKSDATIIVVCPQNSKSDAIETKKILNAHNSNIIGIVFNKVNKYNEKYYYYNKYYKKYYSTYYSSTKNQNPEQK